VCCNSLICVVDVHRRLMVQLSRSSAGHPALVEQRHEEPDAANRMTAVFAKTFATVDAGPVVATGGLQDLGGSDTRLTSGLPDHKARASVLLVGAHVEVVGSLTLAAKQLSRRRDAALAP